MPDRDESATARPATARSGRAETAFGDEPVRAYIAGLPASQREIAQAVDALAARTPPASSGR